VEGFEGEGGWVGVGGLRGGEKGPGRGGLGGGRDMVDGCVSLCVCGGGGQLQELAEVVVVKGAMQNLAVPGVSVVGDQRGRGVNA
jgi:hypothetical protein